MLHHEIITELKALHFARLLSLFRMVRVPYYCPLDFSSDLIGLKYFSALDHMSSYHRKKLYRASFYAYTYRYIVTYYAETLAVQRITAYWTGRTTTLLPTM
jgi:hypothetical protein